MIEFIRGIWMPPSTTSMPASVAAKRRGCEAAFRSVAADGARYRRH
jgi:hypothetical protein